MASTTVQYIIALKDKFSKGLGKATNAVSKFDKATSKVPKGVSDMGKKMAGLVSVAAVGALFVKAGRDVIAYDKAIGSLSAITGATGKTLDGFKDKIGDIASEAHVSSVDVAKAFEIIGSAKPELLSSASALGAVTDAAIVLADASGMDLEVAAMSLTGAMNQFGLGAKQADRAINVLANGAKLGAAAIPLVSQSLEKFGSVASGFNVSLEESVALTEALADKSLMGAEAGTSLRAMMSKMQTIEGLSPALLKSLADAGVNIEAVADATLPMQERIEALAPIANNAGLKMKFFGETGKAAADIILANTDRLSELTGGMYDMTTAGEQQTAQNNTLSKKLDQLSASWTNLFTSNEQVSQGMEVLKTVLTFVADNLGTIVTVLGVAAAALMVFKVAMFAVNLVMYANPVGLVVAGILALIAVVAVVVAKWDEWGAALSLMLGPFGIIISMVQSFRNNWDNITNAFESGGIMKGLLSIGTALLDVVLFPLQQILEVAAKLTGSDLAKDAAQGIENFRNKIGAAGAKNEKDKARDKAVQGMSDSLDTKAKGLAEIDRLAGVQDGVGAKDPLARASLTGAPIAAAGATGAPIAAAGATGGVSGSKTSITSAAPKTINLTINSLIEALTITPANLTEGTTEIADQMKQALLGMLNDVQTDLG